MCWRPRPSEFIAAKRKAWGFASGSRPRGFGAFPQMPLPSPPGPERAHRVGKDPEGSARHAAAFSGSKTILRWHPSAAPRPPSSVPSPDLPSPGPAVRPSPAPATSPPLPAPSLLPAHASQLCRPDPLPELSLGAALSTPPAEERGVDSSAGGRVSTLNHRGRSYRWPGARLLNPGAPNTHPVSTVRTFLTLQEISWLEHGPHGPGSRARPVWTPTSWAVREP